MIPRRLLCARLLFAFLLFALSLVFVNLISGQKDPSSSSQAGGLRVVTLTAKKGDIKVILPDDIRAGDTISGTVIAEPSGKTDKEKQQNSAELNGYVIELENQKSPVSGGIIQRVYLAPAISAASLILFDAKGKQIGSATIPVSPRPTTPGAPGFVVAGVGQTGRPIVVHGPFDGDSSNTNVKIGESNARVIAESPRKVVVESPREVVGPSRIEVNENSTTATGAFRNLKIDLTAPKTSLRKGESTELHVEVNGLQGITQPIPVQVQNQSPSTVNLSGGNKQTIAIQPAQVRTGGTFPWTAGLTGTGNGGFTITATVPSGIYAAPNPSPPPSTQPSGSPVPSTTPTDTVVRRGDPDVPGGGDQARIEMVQLDLQGSRPIATASPTLIGKETTEREVPKVPERDLRPPTFPSPTPTPEPTRPPYVPAPVPPDEPSGPKIPGSGTRIVPKRTPPPPPPPPTLCKCDQVDIKSVEPDKLKVTPGATIFEDPPKNTKHAGFKIDVDTDFIDVTMTCTGDPKSDPCTADLSWVFDAEFRFTMTGANWTPQGGAPGLERATASGGITYKPLGQSSVKQMTLKEKCLTRPGNTPGCQVTKKYSLNREFKVDYPKELIDAINNRKPNDVVKIGEIEIKISMSVTVLGCKSTLEGADNGGNIIIGRTYTIKNRLIK